MNRFKPVIIDEENQIYLNLHYLLTLFNLYRSYSKYLDDDYAAEGMEFSDYFLSNIKRLSPYFWVIVEPYSGETAGFVYLDNFSGSRVRLHSAEVSACFFKKFWGGFTTECAREFFKICFDELGLLKIKALVYPQNFRVKTLLKRTGFKKEGYLKSETLRQNKLQDIEIYSVIKER